MNRSQHSFARFRIGARAEPMSLMFSATYPERTSALVLCGERPGPSTRRDGTRARADQCNEDHLLQAFDQATMDFLIDEIEEFVTGTRSGPEPARVRPRDVHRHRELDRASGRGR